MFLIDLVSACMNVSVQETRTVRVDSWRSFQDSKAKKKKKGKGFSTGLKPPKLKLEKRT